MILPIEWLKEYVKTAKTDAQIAESFTSLGLLLDKPIKDHVMDLEHRMDRSDWLSILGCARDFAAMEGLVLKKPEGVIPDTMGYGNVKIKVEAFDLVKRFNTRVFRGVKVKKSPDWMIKRLEEYGLPAINNIVDITNYVMLELGQPMHAQDLSKFSTQEIVLRRAKNGEVVTTLLGQDVTLDSDTLVLSEGKNIIGIGAIVGSKLTAVDESTTDIVLDAGNYNQSNIRKTSRRLNIRNETVLRTEKFLHPHLTQVAIERATKLIMELAEGTYFDNEDYYPETIPLRKLSLRSTRIKQIGGIELNKETVKNILNALEYTIIEENSAGFLVEVPYFRTDVEVEDDVVSDILRINNYKNIPEVQINEAPPKDVTPEIYTFEEKLRDILVKIGFHEHITNPLVKNSDNKNQIVLKNSLDSEHNALRTSIIDTLSPVIKIYEKHKLNVIKLFEIGLTYHRTGNTYKDINEIRELTAIVSMGKGIELDNKVIKITLSSLFKELGVFDVKYVQENNLAKIYQNKLELGILYPNSFQIYTENLLRAETRNLRVVDSLKHISFEDVTIQIKDKEKIGPIFEKIRNLNENISQVSLLNKYKDEKGTAVTLRVTFETESELTKEELKKIKDKFPK